MSATDPAASIGIDRRVPVREVELACTDTGSGELVVYAHGLTQSRASDLRSGLGDWSAVAAAGRRLVTYDARGHGRSAGTPVAGDYTWPSLARDLLALVDALGVEGPVGGIGSSMGTGTLLHAVVAAPERFDQLVLTAPPTAWATRAGQGEMYRAGAAAIEQHGLGAFMAAAAAAPVPSVFAALPDFPPQPDVAEDLLPTVLRGAADSDLPDSDLLRGLDLPVLVLAWEGDPGHPVSTAERLVELIPGARLQVARTPQELASWASLAADFLARAAG